MFAFLIAVLLCIAAGKSLAEENRQLRRINNVLLKSVAALSEEQVGASFSTGAVFYDGRNYNGESHKYEERTPYGSDRSVVRLPRSLQDKFQSVQIGQFSKVFAWTHYDSMPTTAVELSKDTPDLWSIDGIVSKFKVTPKEVKGVYVRLVDGIGLKTLYCMTPKVYGGGEGADVNACTDNTDFQLLGTLNPTNVGEAIVTQIPVRNMDHNSDNFGQYISNGSLYFKVDSSGKIVVSVDNGEFENFPENLTITKLFDTKFFENRFEIAIISDEPDVDF